MPKPGNGWHRQNRNSPATLARKREYNSPRYKAARAEAKRLVDAGTATCWRCHRPIPPGAQFHLGHDDHNRDIIHGPEHPPCNLRAAARKGNRIRNQRQRNPQTTATWG